ncbi:MAG: choice-of-anchor Q domain-containing protein [Pyrinomonadaceae bacterium]
MFWNRINEFVKFAIAIAVMFSLLPTFPPGQENRRTDRNRIERARASVREELDRVMKDQAEQKRVMREMALAGQPTGGYVYKAPDRDSLPMAMAAQARTIVVHSTADSGPGTLRQALVDAASGGKINIVARGTITLTSGELVVDKSLEIKGQGADRLSISGNFTSRVFHIMPEVNVTIDGLTIADGSVSTESDPYLSSAGGGIFSDHANLTVRNCIISGNSARYGGGIFSNSNGGGSTSLKINSTTLSDNSASFAGGGVFSGGGFLDNMGDSGEATMAIHNSSISDNSAEYGGGIFNDGYLGRAKAILNISTVDNNAVEQSYGIYNNGDSGDARVTLNDSTVTGNVIGIFNDGASYISPGDARLVVNNSKINGNASDGIFNSAFHGSASVTLNRSTVNSNGRGVTNNADANGNATMILSGSTASGNSETGVVNGGYGNTTATLVDSSVNDNGSSGIINWVLDSDSTTLALFNSTVNGNHEIGVYNAGWDGGDAFLTLNGSTVSGITNDDYFAGIYNYADFGGSAAAALTDSTVTGNSAASGCGICNQAWNSGSRAAITLNGSTVSNNLYTNYDPNLLSEGGIASFAVEGDAAVTLINSSVSGNSGRGVTNANAEETGSAKLTLNNCTVAGNSFGPVYNFLNSTLEITNSILDAGTSGENQFYGTVISHGYNISSDRAGGDGSTGPGGLLNGPGDIRNTDPLLGPLANNGGQTKTHALLLGSPAINAGDPNFDPEIFDPPMLYDQRNSGRFPRVINGRIDIGAFESRNP